MLNFLNFSVKFVIIFLAVIVFFAFSTLWYFSVGLPDYKKLSNYQPPISSRVYSENNKLIAEYALEKRLFIPYESIPDKIVNAFLSAEDKNLISSIDAKGILRAIIKILKIFHRIRGLKVHQLLHNKLQKISYLQTKLLLKEKLRRPF